MVEAKTMKEFYFMCVEHNLNGFVMGTIYFILVIIIAITVKGFEMIAYG
jgi:hypothetical protein